MWDGVANAEVTRLVESAHAAGGCFLGRYRSVSTTSPSKYDVDGMATAQDHVITRSHVSRSMRTYGTCLTRNAKAILKPVSACSTC